MAMAVKQHDVKVKFIETQFVSSDAASFKSVVQRLTGKHSSSPAPTPQPQRPRPCRSALAYARGQQAGWVHQQYSGNGYHLPAPKQEPSPRLEELYELCDLSDLLYATAGARCDSGGLPPY